MEAGPSLAPHRASVNSQDLIIPGRVGFVFLRNKRGRANQEQFKILGRLRAHDATSDKNRSIVF
ncbi:MAG: hypothetical protein DMF76_27885 [Acidobacteria bacterium]|nr:MAG: hypothetical protein DMF76_27885 [Acidobacteriota bacterium]